MGGTSQVCKNTRHPQWMEIFHVSGEHPVHEIVFKLYDWENIVKHWCGDKDDYIGEARMTLSLDDYIKRAGHKIDRELELTLPDTIDDETGEPEVRGVLHVTLLPKHHIEDQEQVIQNMAVAIKQMAAQLDRLAGTN